MRCYKISHERLGSCRNRLEKWVMYAEAHPANKHDCEVSEYNKWKDKLYIYVVAWCANCQNSHPANFSQCIIRQKAQIEVGKNKIAKTSKALTNITLTSKVNILKRKSPRLSKQKIDNRKDGA